MRSSSSCLSLPSHVRPRRAVSGARSVGDALDALLAQEGSAFSFRKAQRALTASSSTSSRKSISWSVRGAPPSRSARLRSMRRMSARPNVGRGVADGAEHRCLPAYETARPTCRAGSRENRADFPAMSCRIRRWRFPCSCAYGPQTPIRWGRRRDPRIREPLVITCLSRVSGCAPRECAAQVSSSSCRPTDRSLVRQDRPAGPPCPAQKDRA